jgi:large subunit ribosomal protein L10
LAEQGVRLRMVPNRVARKALAEVGFDFPAQSFKGNVGLAGGDVEQTIHAAKVLSASPLKKAGKVELLAGALEGNVLGAADAGALADVPDRRTLQGKLLGCLNGPAQQLASLLNGPSGALVRVVNAHADASGAGEPAG